MTERYKTFLRVLVLMIVLLKSTAGVSVVMKEKYGPARTFHGVTVVILKDNKFFLARKDKATVVLPASHWAFLGESE